VRTKSEVLIALSVPEIMTITVFGQGCEHPNLGEEEAERALMNCYS